MLIVFSVHDIRLYSVRYILVISGEYICCSVEFGTLFGWFVLHGLS